MIKDKNWFMVLLSYFRRQLGGFILFFVFAMLFGVVFSLYNMPLDAVLYAMLLCMTIGVIVLAIGFFRFLGRHRLLFQMQNRIMIEINGLPDPQDILEEDYHRLIQAVYKDKVRIESTANIRRGEMLDYYTMWVHQIKTPIAAMNLLLQSQEGEAEEELKMELFKIEQYVEMVLQYLRLDSMSSDLVLRRLPLDKIVKQAVRKYAKMFIQKKISLDYQDLDQEVLTDEKWLLFVIEQILSNALKYTPSGYIRIYMEPGMEKTLVVEDTGMGIQAEDLPRVFERGFTGYNGRNDKKSTGLGLYLCKQITEKLSHEMSIQSEEGKGTRVLLDLATVDIRVE